MLYESHVTVDSIEQDAFVEVCRSLSAKPVVIDMDTGSGLRQCMTAKFHRTDYDTAFAEMEAIADSFDSVIRRKLEVVIGTRHKIPEHLYMEFHSKYVVPEQELNQFVALVGELGGHSSRNSLKSQYEPGMVYHFATSRSEDIQRRMVHELPYKLVNTIRECVLYDDNPEIDTQWGCDCGIKQFEVSNG